MQEIVVIDGEITLENVLDGEVELEAITDLDPEVVIGTGGAVYPHYTGSYTVTPSTSQQTLQTEDMVMDDDVTINAVATGSATTPATVIEANPSISVDSSGLITSAVSKTQQITPTVVEGYVSQGTPGNVGVSGSNTQQLSTQGAQTIHPSSTDQSIASGKYLTGAQTIKAVTVTGLTADKILQGNTIKIGDADDDDRIMSVTGTASGGITPTGTKTITANGTGIDVYNYQYADVAVPNSYSASDEGKVVSNGALVAQTSDSVTQNGTVDTTLINSLTVNVSGGGGFKCETGTFTLESDLTLSGSKITQSIPHTLGIVPDVVIITFIPNNGTLTSDRGYIWLNRAVDLDQRLSSSAKTEYGIYTGLSYGTVSDETCVTISGISSSSYGMTSAGLPTASDFKLVRNGSSTKWSAGTYRYFVSEKWW